MPISVRCPGCGKKLKGGDDLAGERVKCPKCGHQFLLAPITPSSPQSPTKIVDELLSRLEDDAHSLNRLKCMSCGVPTLKNSKAQEPRKVLTFPNGDEGFICGQCAYYDRDPNPNSKHWNPGTSLPQFDDRPLIIYVNFWSTDNLVAVLQQLNTRNINDNPNYWKDTVQLPLNDAAQGASTFHWSGLKPSSSSSRVSSSVDLEYDRVGISLAETHRDGSCMWQHLEITRLSNQMFGLQLKDNFGEDGGFRAQPFARDNFLWRSTIVFL